MADPKKEKKAPHPVVIKILALLKKLVVALVRQVEMMRKGLKEPGSVWVEFPFVFKGISSPDQPTRRMSWLFLISLICLLTLSSYGLGQYFQEKAAARQLAAQVEKDRIEVLTRIERGLEHQKVGMVLIGKFVVQLKGNSVFKPSGGPHPLNLAEVDVVVYCDNAETQSYISNHLPQIKDVVNSIFISVDRQEVMSQKGKSLLGLRIQKELNEWLPKGKIEEVFFPRFVIG